MTKQTAKGIFMVRPKTFGFDEQTAATNAFQQRLDHAAETLQARAEAEFDAYVAMLRQHNIEVTVFDDPDDTPKPNAVYPNNWLTTWPDGRLYLYPMATPSRRVERSPAALAQLAGQFRLREIVDLSSPERDHQYLESTGAMVFDHVNRLAYACISPRCDESLFRTHVVELGYLPIPLFTENRGAPVYHTNIMMGIQERTAVICPEPIIEPAARDAVLRSLHDTGHDIVEITTDQMYAFCANVLEVTNRQGEPFLLMSQGAYDAFTPEQLAVLEQDKTILATDLPTIETVGGGGARCMVTEIFLSPLSLPHATPKTDQTQAKPELEGSRL